MEHTNLTILREKMYPVEINSLVHMARISAIKDSKLKTLPENLTELSENSGLIWSISAEQVWKYFNYHENVRGFAIRYNEMPRQYDGDIPDFALERAELGIKLGMKFITLHSIVPVAVDPIMIGWFDYPLTIGFVLAVWCNKMEVDLDDRQN